ncbi:MAG TPA: S41 family peptidase [Patescibacteria group bacterium]|nr:S41 family peptidase [Patescibacteria group bacterium]
MKNRVGRVQVVLLLIITLFVGYYFGVTRVNLDWKNYKPQIRVLSKEPPPELTTVDFSQFWIVWAKLQSNYYDKTKLDPQKMLNGAISGMVQSLGDPFTLYLPPAQNDNFKQGLAGQFSGIGAELGTKDKDIIVISPLDGSPAQKAGVRAGDIILKVDGEATASWNLSQVVEKIRGPKGTDVTLTILHKGDKNSTDVKITRDVITVKSVSGWVKSVKDIDEIDGSKLRSQSPDSQVAYIRLSQFGDNTNKDWLALIDKLQPQTQNDKFKGVVLDLRNNPGGYLTDAVFIASEFLSNNPPQTVVQEESAGFDTRSLDVTRQGKFLNVPVVVLINKGSASASEIVAGALRDHGRAKLVGETSFGKGTVQQAEDLGNGSGIHITIAKWLTPNGTWVNEKGLTPDVDAPLGANDTYDKQLEKAIEVLLK